MDRSNLGSGELGKRRPVAVEVVDFAEVLASRAQELARRADSVLESVAVSPSPNKALMEDQDSREYPPLFCSLRERLKTIESSLDRIDDTLSRVEL